MGSTFTSQQQVSFDADCSPPAVSPTQVSVAPSGSIPCGDTASVTARFANPSHTDAGAAQATLALPDGTSLSGGPATQQVSGGTLAAQATSEQHSWQVKVSGAGSHAATLTGQGQLGTQVFAYPQGVSLSCDRRSSNLSGLAPKRSGKSVKVSGSVAGAPGQPAPTGTVTVTATRKGGAAKHVDTPLDGNGNFAAKLKLSKKDTWTLTAQYGGDGLYTSSSATLGKVREVASPSSLGPCVTQPTSRRARGEIDWDKLWRPVLLAGVFGSTIATTTKSTNAGTPLRGAERMEIVERAKRELPGLTVQAEDGIKGLERISQP